MLEKGYGEEIKENFILKIAEGKEDEINKIIQLNIEVHGEDLEKYIYRLFHHHPNKNHHLWFYIEDKRNGKVVSSGMLFPEIWDFEGIEIPICEMGFVATAEDYRKHGLFSKINQYYEKVMNERGYIMSVIRGVPFFYRRYGYEFSIPLDNGYRISFDNIPETDRNDLIIRKANKEDIKNLGKLYDQWAQSYSITQKFGKNPFIFKYLNPNYSEFQFRTYIIEENNQAKAFFSVGEYFGVPNVIMQTSKMSCKESLQMLNFWKSKTKKDGRYKEDSLLILNPPNSDLGKFILSLGGTIENKWRWQIKIPNLKKFFDLIKPVLEKRIESSIFKDLNKILKLSTYQENIFICFQNGEIKQIELRRGYPEEPDYDLKVPNSHLTQIILGSKTVQEIQNVITDTIYKDEWLLFINTLFPKCPSFCCSYL